MGFDEDVSTELTSRGVYKKGYFSARIESVLSTIPPSDTTCLGSTASIGCLEKPVRPVMLPSSKTIIGAGVPLEVAVASSMYTYVCELCEMLLRGSDTLWAKEVANLRRISYAKARLYRDTSRSALLRVIGPQISNARSTLDDLRQNVEIIEINIGDPVPEIPKGRITYADCRRIMDGVLLIYIWRGE